MMRTVIVGIDIDEVMMMMMMIMITIKIMNVEYVWRISLNAMQVKVASATTFI